LIIRFYQKKKIKVNVKSSDKIGKIKEIIENIENINQRDQVLIANNEVLTSDLDFILFNSSITNNFSVR